MFQSVSLRPGMHSFFLLFLLDAQNIKNSKQTTNERKNTRTDSIFHKEYENKHFSQRKNDLVP